MGKPSSSQLSVGPTFLYLPTNCNNYKKYYSQARKVQKRKSSKKSLNSHKVTNSMSAKKLSKNKKRKKNKLNVKMRKIMDQLSENRSNNSFHSCEEFDESATSQNDSVTQLDTTAECSTANDTVIIVDKEDCNKRKCETENIIHKRRKTNSNCSLIVIGDEEELITSNTPCDHFNTPRKDINTTPVDSSTPLTSKKSKVKSQNNNTIVKNFQEDVINLTKEINPDSYLTIDLTTESGANKSTTSKTRDTVIDLCNINDTQDCTLVSVSQTSCSLSGESDVTVMNMSAKKAKRENNLRKYVKGIAKLNPSEKGKLLELITRNIFNGCHSPKPLSTANGESPGRHSQATETVEDTYIKEVILGEKQSRNSIGSNIYNPQKDAKNKSGLRMIVIDGSNVAMEHGKGKEFSVVGLKICIDYFLKRGHVVKAFVPRFRCKYGKSSHPRLLSDLERQGHIVFTPSREVAGRNIVSYDDRYIVQCAAEFDGVIVSGDNYRDLLGENPRWRHVIENRLLQFTWVRDMIMFPKDPLGRYGPTLERFLKHDNVSQNNGGAFLRTPFL